MITKFDSLFAGHVDMEDVGYNGTPVNDRSYTDEHLATAFDKSLTKYNAVFPNSSSCTFL